MEWFAKKNDLILMMFWISKPAEEMWFQGLYWCQEQKKKKEINQFLQRHSLTPIKSYSVDARNTQPVCCLCKVWATKYVRALIDKGPRLSIRIDIWILLSDTVCQLNQFHTSLWHWICAGFNAFPRFKHCDHCRRSQRLRTPRHAYLGQWFFPWYALFNRSIVSCEK